MTTHLTKLIVTTFAAALFMPAVQLVELPDAEAFGALSRSRSGGKRSHASSKSSSKSKSKSKSSSSSRSSAVAPRPSHTSPTYSQPSRPTVTRTPVHSTTRTPVHSTTRTPVHTTTRTRGGRTTVTTRTPSHTTRTPSRTTVYPRGGGGVVYEERYDAPGHRTTTRRTRTRRSGHRVYSSPSRVTIYDRTPPPAHHHTYRSTRTTVTRTTPLPLHSRTEVHYHNTAPVDEPYYGSDTSGGSTVTSTSQSSAARGDSGPEGYVTGGFGLSGFASSQVASDALPGYGFNLGIGAKSGWVGGEVGFNMNGYRLDPAASASDMTMIGLAVDLKLQPSLSFIEPFLMVGVGGQVFSDYVINESAVGGQGRIGAGVDLRFDQLALTLQYLYTSDGLLGNEAIYQDGMLRSNTETVSVGLKLYF